MASEQSRLDRVEMELARTRDELRRTRLELAKTVALARDALNRIYQSDLPGAAYNLCLALSLGRGEELEKR